MFADALKINSAVGAGALALSSGFFTKVYDDFNDNKMPTKWMPVIQALVIVLTTLFMFQDIRIAIAMGLLTLVSILQKVIDTDFWRICAVMPFLVVLLMSPSFKEIYLLESVLWFIVIVIGAFVEDGLFPEEKSLPKSAARTIFITSLLLLLGIPKSIAGHYYIPQYIRLIMWFCVGYFGNSVLIQNFYRFDVPNEKNAIWEILVSNTIRRFKKPVVAPAPEGLLTKAAVIEGFKPDLATVSAEVKARAEGNRAFDFVARDYSPAPEPTTPEAKAISTATAAALSYSNPKERIIVRA
jgi:hypothetical protein